MFREYVKRLDELHLRRSEIDPEEFPDKSEEGLEGPFSFGGRVLYYDPREGKYYDSRTDMYVTDEEIQELQKHDHDAMNQHGQTNPYPVGHPANPN